MPGNATRDRFGKISHSIQDADPAPQILYGLNVTTDSTYRGGFMGTGLPFIFQIVLLLLLPLALVYLFSVIGVVLMSTRAALKSLFRRRTHPTAAPN
jgi:hypothetical protein